MIDFVMMNLEFFIFVLLLSIFLIIKRKNLEVQGFIPIFYFMLYKTKWGINLMDKWAREYPRLFKGLARYSYFVGVWGLIIGILILVWSLYIVIDNEHISTGGGLVLPIETEGDPMEAAVPVFYVPFWYWIAAIFILVVVHEFAHGVIARRFKVPIKSSGFAFLGILLPIIPAAFVEPDEKKMSSKSCYEQISILGAGSASNFLFGGLFLLFFLTVTFPFFQNTMEVDDLYFSSVDNRSSLYDEGIESGRIISFEGEESSEKFVHKTSNLEVNKTYNLGVVDQDGEERNINITTLAHNMDSQRGAIGIGGIEYKNVPKEGYEWLGSFPEYLNMFFLYLWLLNIGIGLMNLLPLWITDGGRILYILLNRWMSEDNAAMYTTLISFATLLLVIVVIWPDLIYPLIP